MSHAPRIKRFPANTLGRDLAVGDIHGHFTMLQEALDRARFDPTRDRLFSVGDLVDRGPESEQLLRWLNKPWFHAIQGNHEDIAIRHVQIGKVDQGIYLANGGAWFLAMNFDEQANFAALFADLPIAIEVETPDGLVGLVHADCPTPTWDELRKGLEEPPKRSFLKGLEDGCQWSRARIEQENASGVPDIRAVVVGHTPLRQVAVLGNVYHIDTAGWMPEKGGYFTLLDLHTLQAIPPIPGKLEWEAA